VLNPLYLFNIGFQLSYTATLAIIYLQPPLAEALLKLGLPGFVRPALAVTLASQLGVLPLCAYHFQHVPVGALFFNLLLVPLMAPVVGLAWAAPCWDLHGRLPPHSSCASAACCCSW